MSNSDFIVPFKRTGQVWHMTEALCMRCREKGSVSYEQYDAYGIYAGKMCDACFKKDYRQDRYFDPDYAGERLEEEEY